MKGERGGLDWLRPRRASGSVAPFAHFPDRRQQLKALGGRDVTPEAFYVATYAAMNATHIHGR
jgi:hypothetical protein